MSTVSGRGRPKDPAKQQEQKQKLILAAKNLMREKSYKSITIREIGTAAGVNSAMVKYYFDSKEGLFLAAVNSFPAEHFDQIQALVNQKNPIKHFIKFAVVVFGQDAGLARFIHDEILKEDCPLRDQFISGFPTKIAALLPELVAAELKQRGLTVAINTKYAAFNLMSMIIMPQLGAPIRQAAWKITDDELSQDAWVDHLYQQFMFGCIRGQADVNDSI